MLIQVEWQDWQIKLMLINWFEHPGQSITQPPVADLESPINMDVFGQREEN